MCCMANNISQSLKLVVSVKSTQIEKLTMRRAEVISDFHFLTHFLRQVSWMNFPIEYKKNVSARLFRLTLRSRLLLIAKANKKE